MKENMKETRTEKNKMAAKCQELETVSLLAKLFCAYWTINLLSQKKLAINISVCCLSIA